MSLIKGRRINPRKVARLIAVIAALSLVIALLFSGSDSQPESTLSAQVPSAQASTPSLSTPAPAAEASRSISFSDLADSVRPVDPWEIRRSRLASILSLHRDDSPLQPGFDSMPPGGIKLRINYLGANLGRVFNDSNYLHLEAARRIGVAPVSSASDLWHISRPLARVQSCGDYYVDNLTHSHPYLVPEARDLLTDIGAAFRDSLRARGGGDYRIKVTSVFRTKDSVRSLRRRNRNAVSESTHLYATTFDISYSKFICDDPSLPRTQEDLKNLLGEVLHDMRRQGRCLVKYERRQACFHITATGL